MTIHAIKEFARYWWTARDLHGVHSPFAYEFSEKVLSEKNKLHSSSDIKQYKWLPAHYYKLLDRILAYYQYKSIHCLTHDNEDEAGTFDMLLLKDDAPGHWVRLFNKYYPHLQSNCAIMIAGIHKSKRHSAKWERLYKHPKVQMSIDLFGVGLLFFRKEFKEKQHFVLKY